MTTYAKRYGKDLIRNLSVIMFAMNMICLILGAIYLDIGDGFKLLHIYGFIMMMAYAGNVILAYLESRREWMGYLYLIISSLWMIILPIINTYFSLDPSNDMTQSFLSIIMVFSLFILGCYLSLQNMEKQGEPLLKTTKIQSIQTKKIIVVVLCILLFSGIFLNYMILRDRSNGIVEAFISEYALFYACFFYSTGGILFKLLKNGRHKIVRSMIWIVIPIIVIVCLLPVLSTPFMIRDAKRSYSAAFGLQDTSKTNYSSEMFRQTPFSLPDYFFGIPSLKYKHILNVPFYHGTEGTDKGILLKFDVYMPADSTNTLPGGNSVLIRIHGGSWSAGDKGMYNCAQVNKYFASRGYVVFDIQYGLKKENKLDILPRDNNRSGEFTIDDMVRHIGIFTKYLADHKDEYHANTDSVFISGGSAGGQLALAVGLGLTSGEFQDILDSKIHVKGLIPLYPANGLARYLDIDGSNEFVDPIELVTHESPPCIIYQGMNDGLVDRFIVKRFQKEYLRKGNQQCAILFMPFAGHVSDLYFAGYYNQTFIYYMERFLYQYR